jgi:hypothetical protein
MSVESPPSGSDSGAYEEASSRSSALVEAVNETKERLFENNE